MKRANRILLICSLASLPLCHGALAAPAAPSAVCIGDGVFNGSWRGEFVTPFDPKPLVIRLGLQSTEEGKWRGGFDGDMFGPGLVLGDERGGCLQLECDLGGATHAMRVCESGENSIELAFKYRGLPIALDLKRSADDWSADLQFEVQLPKVRPTHISLKGLPDMWLAPIQSKVNEALDSEGIVGLALAIVVDGELLDARAWGWSDVARGRAIDGETLFRWASISKGVTGVVAGKLALAGTLDLDLDVRELVPEFPEKTHVVTARQLLGHLGGIVHYQHMPRVTRTDYGVEFPFRDAVRAIDMFRDAPLIHAPGSAYSYSTHGFVLAGAVIERSSTRGYQGEVRRLVSDPLKMRSFGTDDPAAPNPRRSTGYRIAADGRVFEAGDSNVAWKLAGGGYQSTVADLARFGAGLTDEGFIDEGLQELLFVSQKTSEGESTGYSLGLNVAHKRGRLLVSHGGAQRRARTYLVCAPAERLAVAVMCNTEGTNMQGLGTAILRVLLDEQ